MKVVPLSLLVVSLVLSFFLQTQPVAAAPQGYATVVLSIEARNCEQGMDHCQNLADAYIRVVAGSKTKETSTDSFGRATVAIDVTTPTLVSVYLNNEVVREVYAGTVSEYYYFELSLDYLPKVLFIPVVRR